MLGNDVYSRESFFSFKSSTFGLQFFLPCLCIREGAQKLSRKALLKAELSCQGYSKFSLLAVCWGDVLSQASCRARAACQLLGSFAGKRGEKLGALHASTRGCCKSHPPVIKPSVPLNGLVVVLCACVVCAVGDPILCRDVSLPSSGGHAAVTVSSCSWSLKD